MAEIVNTIIDKLASFISTEEVLVREVAYIKNELQIVTDFLKDADNIPEQLAAVKTWVRLAYKIEDILDQHQLVFINQNEFLKSILEIKEEILEIQCRKQVYNILQVKAESTDDLRNHRSSFLYAQDSDELVGIEQPRNKVFELLNLEETDMERSVIAVVGMGGIGKSTLAWRIYEDVEVKRYFYVHAWISVTQVYSRKDLLHVMIQQVYKAAMQSLPSEVAQMDEQALIGELRNFLKYGASLIGLEPLFLERPIFVIIFMHLLEFL